MSEGESCGSKVLLRMWERAVEQFAIFSFGGLFTRQFCRTDRSFRVRGGLRDTVADWRESGQVPSAGDQFNYRSEGECDWSSRSQERELARAHEYQSEIARQLGTRGRFRWVWLTPGTMTKPRLRFYSLSIHWTEKA
jgi:hypothetical protein